MRKSSRNCKASSKPARRTNVGEVAGTGKSVPPARRSARQPASRKSNKQAKLIELLKRPAGATIAALSEVSGWQQHSVRGFLAGVVRKKLGLELVSAVEAEQRVYRIVSAAAKQAS